MTLIINRPPPPKYKDPKIWFCSPAYIQPIDDSFFDEDDYDDDDEFDDDDEDNFRPERPERPERVQKVIVNVDGLSIFSLQEKVKEFLDQCKAHLKFFDEKHVMLSSENPADEYGDEPGVFLFIEDFSVKFENEHLKSVYDEEMKMYNEYIAAQRKAESAAQEELHLNKLRLQKAAIEREIFDAERKRNKKKVK